MQRSQTLSNGTLVRMAKGEIALAIAAIEDLDDAAIVALVRELVADYEFLRGRLGGDELDIILELRERDDRLPEARVHSAQVLVEGIEGSHELRSTRSVEARSGDTLLCLITEQQREYEQRLTRLETKNEQYEKSLRPSFISGIVFGSIVTFLVIVFLLAGLGLIP